MDSSNKILRLITDYYLNSGDFNGINLICLLEELDLSLQEIVSAAEHLIKNDLVGLITSKEEMNPNIIRTGFITKDKQIANLYEIKDYYSYCFYPLNKHLETVVNKVNYKDEYYKLKLALGAPQLSYKVFDLSILEMYRNDPRYYYTSNDIGGSICIQDKFYESDEVKEKDKILLESFGFAYDEEFNRAVAVFTCDLANLTKEHQNIWKAKELNNNYNMHPAFYNSQVFGLWPEGVSVFDALLEEIYLINRLCDIIEIPKLFKNDFGENGEQKPKILTFLIRPTLKEFNDFVLVLDKVLSDNINIEFFKADLSLEREEVRKNGKIVVHNKGTIQLLDEWMRIKFNFKNDATWKYTIHTLKKVRKLRQKPAHAIEEDSFNNEYFKKQREIASEVYHSINYLRMVFQEHPKAFNKIDIPDWLEKGKIYSY